MAFILGHLPQGEESAGPLEKRMGTKLEALSPYHHVKPGAPPTLITFGTDDHLLEGARRFQAAMQHAGNGCELKTWEGLPRGFFNFGRFDNKPFEETMAATDAFLVSLGYLK